MIKVDEIKFIILFIMNVYKKNPGILEAFEFTSIWSKKLDNWTFLKPFKFNDILQFFSLLTTSFLVGKI